VEYQYHFNIAEIPMYWISEIPLTFSERYRPFLRSGEDVPELVVRIVVGKPDRNTSGEILLHEEDRYRVEEDAVFRYRTFPYIAGDWENATTLMRRKDCSDAYTIWLPEKMRNIFPKVENPFFYMAFDEMLYLRGRIMLHASYVETKSGAVLFTGPSGIGKSTQAGLWEGCGYGKIMNGDRTILYEKDGTIFASGSPCAGSSHIYRNYQSPVRAVIVLEQGEENQIHRLVGRKCLFPLLKESTFSYMDEEMKRKQAELLFAVAERIPVYHYRCRKDESAVEYLYGLLQGGDTGIK